MKYLFNDYKELMEFVNNTLIENCTLETDSDYKKMVENYGPRYTELSEGAFNRLLRDLRVHFNFEYGKQLPEKWYQLYQGPNGDFWWKYSGSKD